MKELCLWWFSPKQPYSIVRIPVGTIIVIAFIFGLITNVADCIAAFRISLLFFPGIFFVFFAETILASGIFYFAYAFLGEEETDWKSLLRYSGILFGVSILLKVMRVFWVG